MNDSPERPNGLRWYPTPDGEPIEINTAVGPDLTPYLGRFEADLEPFVEESFQAPPLPPEGTLTEVILVDEHGAGPVGHAEVVRDANGHQIIRIYGNRYNAER